MAKNNEQTTQYKKMTETPIQKLILTLGLPTTISMLVTNIYNMADTYFVSQLGTSASGAVGIVFGLMAIIQAFGFMLGQGAGSILSRSLGAQNEKKASRTASKAFFASLSIGIIISVLGLIFLEPLMRLLGSTETILPYAKTYAMYILLATPFMTASFTMNNIMRYEGHASLAMVGLMTGGVINIFGDWFLMEICELGIMGAGISTAVSQVISFSILLFMFLSGRTQCRLSLRMCRDFSETRELFVIMKTGFPSLVRQGLTSVSTMLLNGQAAMYGDAAVAAMSIVGRICFFIFAIGLGLGQGFQPVSAYNYGAKKYSRVKKGFFFTFGVGEVILGILFIPGIIFSGNLIGLFRNDLAVIEIGTFALRAQLITLLLQPLSTCSNMLFQSIGRNKEATLLSSLRNGVAFIPVLLILSRMFGLTGVQISQSVADTITFVVSIPFVIHFMRELSVKSANEKNA